MIGARFANYAHHTRPAIFCRRIVTPSDRNFGKVGGRHPQRILSTLNPLKLQSKDYLDISGHLETTVAFPHSKSGRGLLSYYSTAPRGTPFQHQPFPSNSRGFLYYSRDPQAAALEGSIRLRLTSDNTPSSFLDGRDLRLPWGSTWQLILPQIATQMSHRRFSDQLLHEKLVTQEQLSQCTKLFGHRCRWVPSLTLFRLSQEFPLHFEGRPVLTVVGGSLHQLELPWIFGHPPRAWSGSGIARFEPSTSPEDAGKRIVHMRIIKITEPVVCADEKRSRLVPRPVEGQLVMVNLRGVPKLWAYDIEKNTVLGAAFRALWDASHLPTQPSWHMRPR
ncbi:hypothetical protein C8F04DRAFT_1088631 [Mycena alexandri]|uniref:Uncharacterized protein n=1 Tax=Mycena alexandri TaxID=1745969 RepID=A0AAD6T3W9_9AGAR|nr:hypothetical protein C8F04DRAFT_1088631 [Mycena alexandri]